MPRKFAFLITLIVIFPQFLGLVINMINNHIGKTYKIMHEQGYIFYNAIEKELHIITILSHYFNIAT